MGITPWGWAQSEPSPDFSLFLTSKVLSEVGIALTNNMIWGSSTFNTNKTTYLSHLAIQVDIALSPQNTAFDYSTAINVIDQAQYLTADSLFPLQNKIKNYMTVSDLAALTPKATNKISSSYSKTRLITYQRFFFTGDFNVTAPGYEGFPGTINSSDPNAVPTSKTYTLTSPGFE